MAKQTCKAQLLSDIHTERRRLESNLSALSAEDMLQPGVTGSWSVKDILAHLVAWERLFLEWYHAGLQGSSSATAPVGMCQTAMHALNQTIYEQNRGRSLDDVLADFHASYQQIMAIIEAIPEEDMFIHDRFVWTGKLTLADYIAGNTCNHYAWAKSQIRKWAQREAGEARKKTWRRRNMKILPVTAVHYPGMAEVINSLYPENPTTGSEIEAGDQRRDPRFKFQHWVAIQQDQVIGMGSYSQSIWFDHPQKFMLWIGVRPEHQCRGIGSALFETVLRGLQPFDPIALRTTATEDRLQSIQFLENRGFKEVIRDLRSELDVQSFDMSRFTGLEEHFNACGIQIKTLPELADDPLRNQKLYDLDWEMSLSVPGDLAAGIGRRGLDRYVEFAITGPDALPGGFFVAVKGDEYVGLSHVLSREKGVSLYQGLTGVKPIYRRLGVGLAMKVRVIAYAKATGHLTILAENDAKNLPMLAMNEKLGYIRKPDLITFEKEMRF